jgi:N-acetylmuramoyl-L-alanine amidase
MITGTGFPPFRGGLLRWADARHAGRAERLVELAAVHGPRFEPAPLIRERATAGRVLLSGRRRRRGAALLTAAMSTGSRRPRRDPLPAAPARRSVFRQRSCIGKAAASSRSWSGRRCRARAAAGRVILEPDAPVVWFTFEDAWHDIGRFHTADGAFTGFYANLLTPVKFRAPLVWETTDLFLDLSGSPPTARQCSGRGRAGRGRCGRGWLDADAASSRAEAARLMSAAAGGAWPPAIVVRVDPGAGARDSGAPGRHTRPRQGVESLSPTRYRGRC